MEKTKNVDVMLERELPTPFRMFHLFERKPHYEMDFHQHETFYHVNLVLSGEVRVICKNETANIHQNQVFVVPPGPVSYTHLDVYKRQGQYQRKPAPEWCVLS